MSTEIGAIILAAGKGKRMKAKHVNKVAMLLADKPMILHEIHFLEALGIAPIVVVVGFAKDSVKEILKEKSVIFAEQTKRLGTAHAVASAVKKLPEGIENVLVIQGDDSVFYRESTKATIQKLINTHISTEAAVTFLTVELDNPFGLGRIVRDKDGSVIGIVEEKDATLEQQEIREINPACYVFSVAFLKKFLPKVGKSLVTGEYYLTSLLDVAFRNNQKVQTFAGGRIPWRGVNTPLELLEAEKILTGKA